MKELKINGSVEFPANFTFWNQAPRFIENSNEIEQIELHNKPEAVMQLRYMAEELMSSEFSVYDDCILSRDTIEEESYICSDNLNLANGDGYRISDTLIIDYLFAIELYESVRGCLALYNEEEDSYTYWLIY